MTFFYVNYVLLLFDRNDDRISFQLLIKINNGITTKKYPINKQIKFWIFNDEGFITV